MRTSPPTVEIMSSDDTQFLLFCLRIAREKFLENRELVLNDSKLHGDAKAALGAEFARHAERAAALSQKLAGSGDE